MHMQPVFQNCDVRRGSVAESLFADGLCLPSGSNLTPEQQQLVIAAIQQSRTATPAERVVLVRA